MLQDALAVGLVAVAALSSCFVLLTGDLWLLTAGVLLPLTTALASVSSAE